MQTMHHRRSRWRRQVMSQLLEHLLLVLALTRSTRSRSEFESKMAAMSSCCQLDRRSGSSLHAFGKLAATEVVAGVLSRVCAETTYRSGYSVRAG